MATSDPVNEDFIFKVPVGQANKTQRCSRFPVPMGSSVRVRGHNGVAGNAGVVLVGVERTNEPLAPNTETQLMTRDLIHIVFSGAEGDGVIVTVKGA